MRTEGKYSKGNTSGHPGFNRRLLHDVASCPPSETVSALLFLRPRFKLKESSKHERNTMPRLFKLYLK